MNCPNCSAPMFAGEQCPECEHDDSASADCQCDTCIYGDDDDGSELDSELEDDSDFDWAEVDDEDEEGV